MSAVRVGQLLELSHVCITLIILSIFTSVHSQINGGLSSCAINYDNNSTFTSSCNSIKMMSSQAVYLNLQGFDILFDNTPTSVCSNSFTDQCLQFFNQTYINSISSGFMQVNAAILQKYNNTNFVWNTKYMSKPLELVFQNLTNVYDFASAIELYNYCNFCNHSLFGRFQALKANSSVLGFSGLLLAYQNDHCLNGIPLLDGGSEILDTTYGYRYNVFLQCNCWNGDISNICDFYADVIYPIFLGQEVLITSNITYCLLFLVALFLNFIPVLTSVLRKFFRSDNSFKNIFFCIGDLRLQSCVLFLLSLCLAIISSILGVAGNYFAVLTMTLSACLEFIGYIPILFVWIDVIYRTEMNMPSASLLIT